MVLRNSAAYGMVLRTSTAYGMVLRTSAAHGMVLRTAVNEVCYRLCGIKMFSNTQDKSAQFVCGLEQRNCPSLSRHKF